MKGFLKSSQLSLVAFSSLKKLDANLMVSTIHQFSGLWQSQNALNTHTHTLKCQLHNATFYYSTTRCTDSSHINTVAPSSTQLHFIWLSCHVASPETFSHIFKGQIK